MGNTVLQLAFKLNSALTAAATQDLNSCSQSLKRYLHEVNYVYAMCHLSFAIKSMVTLQADTKDVFIQQ